MPSDPRPAPVRTAEAAVAGGACGYPVALYFLNYPAPERALLWNRFAARVGPGQSAQVDGGGDIATIVERLHEVRLVLVHEPRLHPAVARAVAYAGRTARPRPAVFSAGPAPDPEDDPGGTLVVHGHPATVAAVTEWCHATPAVRDLVLNPPDSGPALDPRLESLCRPGRLGQPRLRDAMILRGLLAGAWLLRPDRATEGVRVQPDYELVRSLLEDPAFSTTDDPGHPLAAAMVGRANVYLRYTLRDPAEAASTDGVTRAELADLGNPGGRKVRGVLEALLDTPDGFAAFRQMGTPPELGADWPTRDVRRLAEMLIPWSPKQVRTTFERLLREGLIGASRLAENQPYRYRLPDRLRPRGSPFRTLPTPEDLEQAAPDVACPACPPPAPGAGPTEMQPFSV